jgi:amidase
MYRVFYLPYGDSHASKVPARFALGHKQQTADTFPFISSLHLLSSSPQTLLMNRRNFIKTGTMAGFVLPSVLLSSCDRPQYQVTTDSPPGVAPFELDEFTVADLKGAMEEGKYSSHAITKLYLDRIAAIDQAGPKLNSVIEINPDALQIAEALDEERKNGKIRGPLHGIPVLIKDNIDSADQMMTTAGALAMVGNKPAQDAFIVQQLREAGAVLLGKTNLSEWANFRSSRSSSGWSSRGGQTKNPFVLDRNPCGSSSGSGTAVSANLCAIAIGTETDGSIACPSSINGVVGIKPTVGLWSRSGIIPISHTQDTAGPMARTVADAVLLLGALTGLDARDTQTKESEGKSQRDYSVFLKQNGLQGKRIGIEKSYLKVHEAVDSLLQEAIDTMRKQGAEIVEVDFRDKLKGISGKEYTVLLYQFKDGVNRYLATSNAPVKTLKEVIAFNQQNESKAMPFFKQEILESAEAKGDLNSKEYLEALDAIQSVSRKAIDDTLKEFNLGCLCGPTNGPSWCTDLVNGDFFTGYGMYSPAAVAGYPHISVPMGRVEELPVGLTFLSKAYDEGGLIEIAYAYEQASRKRKAPSFRGSLI